MIDPLMYQKIRTKWIEQVERKNDVGSMIEVRSKGKTGSNRHSSPHTSKVVSTSEPKPAFNDWLDRLKAKGSDSSSSSTGKDSIRTRLEGQKRVPPVGIQPIQKQPSKPELNNTRKTPATRFYKRMTIMKEQRKIQEHKVVEQLHPQYAQRRYRLSFLIREKEEGERLTPLGVFQWRLTLLFG